MIRKVFYLEDDKKIGHMVKLSIETINDYCPIKVYLFEEYKEFSEALFSETPNLIILDLMLPDLDGFEVLKRLKMSEQYKDIPVIVVSAKISEYDRVKCIEAGAVNYFTKPFFGLMELNSFIKNFMNITNEKTIFTAGDIMIDDVNKIVMRKEEVIKLTKMEYDLLKYFVINKDICVTKVSLIKEIWNDSITLESRTVDAHIKTLRQKVFTDCLDKIETIPKQGYIFHYAKK